MALAAAGNADMDADRLSRLSDGLRALVDLGGPIEPTFVMWRMILKMVFPDRPHISSESSARAFAGPTGEIIGRVLNAGTQVNDGTGEAVLPVLRQMCDAIDAAVAKAQKKPGPAP